MVAEASKFRHQEEAKAKTSGQFPASSDTNEVILCFPSDDPENPYNWSARRKMFIIFTAALTLFNSTLASAIPSNALPAITAEFGISDAYGNSELALPISIFLVGYIFGPLVFGPLSELRGRRRVMQLTFAGYTCFTLACALAPSWTILLVFRLLAGIFASAPVTVGGGIVADIHYNPVIRGRAMTYFLAANIFAPLLAPILSGYISEISWRWAFWAALIIAGVSWIPLALLPETYGPAILARRAKATRKLAHETGQGNPRTYAAIEVEQKGWHIVLGVVLARPLRMLATELMVTTTCLYLAVVYGIYYMYFQSYPIIFKGIYGMSPGVMGLMYLPIGGGIGVGLVVFRLWDSYLQKSRKEGKQWALKEENRRLPLACIGAPLFVVSLFWLGWTARGDIPWVVPFLAGIPFGIGSLLIFIAMLNYLGDAYGIFSASVMAASACCRSIFGAALPLATASMYSTLGIDWATSLLGFVSLAACGIPFTFIYYGDAIRERSAFCRKLKEEDSSREGAS